MTETTHNSAPPRKTHTPGPWEVVAYDPPEPRPKDGDVVRDERYYQGFAIDGADGNEVASLAFADTSWGLRPTDEGRANANLIAAATDMLHTLKDVLAFIEAGVECPPGKDMEVRAVINRAEGNPWKDDVLAQCGHRVRVFTSPTERMTTALLERQKQGKFLHTHQDAEDNCDLKNLGWKP